MTACGLPPGPRLPGVVQVPLLATRPGHYLERCRRRYGDCFRLRLAPFGDIVYFASPEAAGSVFGGEREVLEAGRANAVVEPVVGPRSLLLLDGDGHLRRRRVLAGVIRGDVVDRWRAGTERAVAADLERWPVGRPFALLPRLQQATLHAATEAILGATPPGRLARLRAELPRLLAPHALVMWFPALRRGPGGAAWRRFERARERVDGLLYREIAERRERGTRGDDVLGALMAADGGDDGPLDDGELRDQIVTLLLTGHETTAAAAAWAFERVLRHPAVLHRLRRELDRGEDAYLEAVVKETLRVRPVIMDVARTLSAGADVGGRALPAGTIVVASIGLVHRSAAHAEASEFRPERFLAGKPPAFGWIPFGGGARRCLGAGVATEQLKAVLAAVLSRAELRPARRSAERVGIRHTILVPAQGARVVLERRTTVCSRGGHDSNRSCC